MKTKVVIHPDFESFRDYVERIPEHFDSVGDCVFSDRNQVRVDKMGENKIAIKSYRRIYLTNRIRYSFFAKSKAQRAFENGCLLLERGFLTPQPIAYIECYKSGLLSASYFVSLYTDFRPLSTIREAKFLDIQALLSAFAKHTYRLHQHNIYHIDYSIGNVLYKLEDGDYQFMLIDNNRMKFGAVSFIQGVKNFHRVDKLSPESLAWIAKEYAVLCGKDEIVSVERLFHFKRNRMRRKALKRKGKRLIA